MANGYEPDQDDVLQGVAPWEDRFTYYMRMIAENAASFQNIQRLIETQYSASLNFDSGTDLSTDNVLRLTLQDLQTDFSILNISSSLSSALNLYLNKALQLNTLQQSDLQGLTIPYLDVNFDPTNPGVVASPT